VSGSSSAPGWVVVFLGKRNLPEFIDELVFRQAQVRRWILYPDRSLVFAYRKSFLRPTQSEAMLLQFGDLVLLRSDQIVDRWSVMPAETATGYPVQCTTNDYSFWLVNVSKSIPCRCFFSNDDNNSITTMTPLPTQKKLPNKSL
jgi:hypothetical protein